MALVPPPTVTAESIAVALKKPATDPAVEAAYATAVALLEDVTAKAWRPIPEAVMDSLVTRVTRAEYEGRTRSQFGGTQATQVQGETAMRPPRDPLAAAAPILALYVLGMA